MALILGKSEIIYVPKEIDKIEPQEHFLEKKKDNNMLHPENVIRTFVTDLL